MSVIACTHTIGARLPKDSEDLKEGLDEIGVPHRCLGLERVSDAVADFKV